MWNRDSSAMTPNPENTLALAKVLLRPWKIKCIKWNGTSRNLLCGNFT